MTNRITNLGVAATSISLAATISAFGVLFSGAATADQSYRNPTTANIPLLGQILNQDNLELAEEIRDQYLSNIDFLEGDQQFAKAVVVYVGDDFVVDGEFAVPSDVSIPATQLEILQSKSFPDDGCRVERLFFSDNEEFIVLLVDGSYQPETNYIEQCLLLASLTALGEDSSGTPVRTTEELRNELEALLVSARSQ
ncbi:MAG: hypothetical protein P8Q92_09035 [Pseudoprimorskyibacter sp.]|nr:hypothetical protein [Pseudoprimorskyibacter sp.]